MTIKKKPGRHPEFPMDTMIRVRMNQIVLHELDTCAKAWNTTRSDVIRRGIHRLYDDLNR